MGSPALAKPCPPPCLLPEMPFLHSLLDLCSKNSQCVTSVKVPSPFQVSRCLHVSFRCPWQPLTRRTVTKLQPRWFLLLESELHGDGTASYSPAASNWHLKLAGPRSELPTPRNAPPTQSAHRLRTVHPVVQGTNPRINCDSCFSQSLSIIATSITTTISIPIPFSIFISISISPTVFRRK